MVAQEFFSYIKTYGNSEGLTVKMDVGTPIARLRYKGVIIDEPAKLLILEDLYPPQEYMYTRFISDNEMEIVDSNAREPEDLRIEMVSRCDDAIVITARFVGTE